MTRAFDEHLTRTTQSLSGRWDFRTDPDNAGLDQAWAERFPEPEERLYVPGTWNNTIAFFDYRGAAWYRRRFRTGAGHHLLRFGAVAREAVVFVDGREAGRHVGGFLPFDVALPDLEAGEHEVIVRVDNTHDDAGSTVPKLTTDWFHYGGIPREVRVQPVPALSIDRLHCTSTIDDDVAEVAVDVRLRVLPGAPAEARLRVTVGDVSQETTARVADGVAQVDPVRVRLDGVRLWSPESPNLYTVRVELPDDDLIDRIGVREITIQDAKVLINGQPVEFRGVNRHEDHPEWGLAMPPALVKRDVDIIQSLGCNTIRGSHYPNDPLVLDLCDERGILYWDEVPLWGFPEQLMAHEGVRRQNLQMLEEMIDRDFNHPSIYVWSVLNECATDTPAGREATEMFVSRVRELDPSRPVGFASNRNLKDICWDLVDVLGINIYPGWYGSSIEAWPEVLQGFVDKLAADGRDNLPLIVTEFGAGAVRGDDSFELRKWNEGYQGALFEQSVRTILTHPRTSGFYIWQYCDTRTAPELALNRPRTFNNKGVVDEFRRPKRAWWAVKRLLQELK